MSGKPGPQSSDESIIHALNIHGTFFESWCKEVISLEGGGWHISSYEGVEFPPPTTAGHRGKESHSDIRAEYSFGGYKFTLVIECKKHNPKLVKWVFFPKHRQRPTHFITYPEIQGNYVHDVPRKWQITYSVLTRRLFGEEMIISDEARETRETYLKKGADIENPATANTNINEAVHQVAIATQYFYSNRDPIENRNVPTLGHDGTFKDFFLPVIVTTAELFVCEHNASDVIPEKGEIPYDKASLTAKDWLIYEYSLPRHLQHSKEFISKMVVERQYPVDYTRMHILVVQSQHFPKVLRDLRSVTTQMIWI